ncbi:hypothetical protein [uncultured Kordia sp.]|uniref:hypothetical protein n=1 Tax=uncultured Kordia sp. TaxID=507699 RepID=UPI00260E78D5|nr:hypothetical protein [uncultured Kordia sp.]
MKLRISRWIFLALIVSSFFFMVYGRHVGGPWVLFEFFIFLNLPEIIQRGDFINFLPFLVVLTGQLLFLFLGLKTVSGTKLWLLLIAPLLVTIPLLIALTEMVEFQRQTTISAIPFLVMVVVFYVECIFKLTKSKQIDSF